MMHLSHRMIFHDHWCVVRSATAPRRRRRAPTASRPCRVRTPLAGAPLKKQFEYRRTTAAVGAMGPPSAANADDCTTNYKDIMRGHVRRYYSLILWVVHVHREPRATAWPAWPTT
eukprot:scaffold122313_cov69-Phaeocystis_antarctica.AAC.2